MTATANIDIRRFTNMPKSFKPAIPRTLIQIVQMTADDAVALSIRMISSRIIEAFARVYAVREPVHPNAEQVVAVARR